MQVIKRKVSWLLVVSLVTHASTIFAADIPKEACDDGKESIVYELPETETIYDGLRGKDLSGPHSLNSVKDPVNSQDDAIKFTLAPDDIVKNGNRAELIVNDFRGTQYRYRYKLKLLIPSSYVSDSKWQVFFQWHDQPDFSVGETWQSLPSRAPPLALFYLKEHLYIIHRTDEDTFVRSEKVKVERDSWNEIAFDVNWALDESGRVQATINGSDFVQEKTGEVIFSGPNMYNKAGNYMKFGIYRSDDSTSTNSILFKDIQVHAICKGMINPE
ncbi:heparin lyase I family protein [Bowmanella denitrificans]|uniref:heparin lyase I family protein n=1 Tax=Bowmanella denitrificans TaxID=366582 RepID=UPI000C9C672A|nr:heparin lyase I family protein [Bowmanella denitrificans]